jgi:hypothetical protein
MLGWTILFGLISLSGMAVTLTSYPVPFYLKSAIVVSTTLFLVTLLTRVVRRGRAR